jgi:hypothetical protein
MSTVTSMDTRTTAEASKCRHRRVNPSARAPYNPPPRPHAPTNSSNSSNSRLRLRPGSSLQKVVTSAQATYTRKSRNPVAESLENARGAAQNRAIEPIAASDATSI